MTTEGSAGGLTGHSRTLEVGFEEFGAVALSDLSAATGSSPESLVAEACMRFLDAPPEGPARLVPEFAREDSKPRVLTISFDAELWERLLAEARAQNVDPERLAEHAFLTRSAGEDENR